MDKEVKEVTTEELEVLMQKCTFAEQAMFLNNQNEKELAELRKQIALMEQTKKDRLEVGVSHGR